MGCQGKFSETCSNSSGLVNERLGNARWHQTYQGNFHCFRSSEQAHYQVQWIYLVSLLHPKGFVWVTAVFILGWRLTHIDVQDAVIGAIMLRQRTEPKHKISHIMILKKHGASIFKLEYEEYCN